MRKIPVQKLALTALFVALTAVGAFIRVPLGLMVFTLQIPFVFLAGALLGPGYGALSQLVYILLGLAGVPILAEGGGFSYVLRPSFGFLIGYIAGAAVVGALLKKKKASALRIALACVSGLAAIYTVGLPYMALILNGYMGSGKTAAELVKRGMLIYLPGDAVKIVLTTVLARVLIPVLRREIQ